MAKGQARNQVSKSNIARNPNATKTGKVKLQTLTLAALETLKKTTKKKQMAKLNKELAKRVTPIV